MWLWFIGGGLFAVWLISVLLGKGGFVHVLILCAVPILVVQWIATRESKDEG